MFWTIVGALLFVSVGIPVILYLLALAGIGTISFFAKIADRSHNKGSVIDSKKELALEKRNNRIRWSLVIGGVIFTILAIIGLGLSSLDSSNNSNYVSPYQSSLETNFTPISPAPLPTTYEEYISVISKNNPDKTIYPTEINGLKINLPSGLNYSVLKQKLKDLGFRFVIIGPQGTIVTEPDANVIPDLIAKLKTKYPDKRINNTRESDIIRNLPSNVSYTVLKDAILEAGFEFIGFEYIPLNKPTAE